MSVAFQQVFAILFEAFEVLLILFVLLTDLPQVLLQLLPNSLFLLLFLLSAELRLALLQLLLLAQSYSKLLCLVLHSLDQLLIAIFSNQFVMDFSEVGDSSFSDDGRLQELENGGTVLLLLLQHFLDQLPQLLGVELADWREIGLENFDCQSVEGESFEGPSLVAHLVEDAPEGPNIPEYSQLYDLQEYGLWRYCSGDIQQGVPMLVLARSTFSSSTFEMPKSPSLTRWSVMKMLGVLRSRCRMRLSCMQKMARAICVAQSTTCVSSNFLPPCSSFCSTMSWLRSPPAQNSMMMLSSCPSMMDSRQETMLACLKACRSLTSLKMFSVCSAFLLVSSTFFITQLLPSDSCEARQALPNALSSTTDTPARLFLKSCTATLQTHSVESPPPNAPRLTLYPQLAGIIGRALIEMEQERGRQKPELFLNFIVSFQARFFHLMQMVLFKATFQQIAYGILHAIQNRVIHSLLCPNKQKEKGVYGGSGVGEWVGLGGAQTIKEQFKAIAYNYFLVLLASFTLSIMTSSGSTQSQPSYFPIILEKPPLEFLIQSIKEAGEEGEAGKAMAQLAEVMRGAQGECFEQCLLGVNHLFQKGYTSVFMTYVDLMRKMMNHFTRLGRTLQDDAHDQNIQFRMLYTLSLIAELIRENPKFYFPFTRKFLATVFRIDYELLQNSARKRDILAILSVIYENFSRQGRLVNKYSMLATLKNSLLENYSLIEELFTLKVFNRAICNLATKGLLFTSQEFKKHRVLETLAQFIEKSQIELFMVKLKMAMRWLGKEDAKNGSAAHPQAI